MKKTIIAAAIAAVVAAPAAFAEVSISGQINQEFTNDGDDTTNGATGADAGAPSILGAVDQNAGDDGLENDTNVDIVFKASEDLGNGMKVTATMHMLYDSGNGGQGTANETIAVSGDFGTVMVGRMEDFTESKFSAVADTWDPVDGFSLEDQNTLSQRLNGGIAYVSPSMNGFSFGVAGYALEQNQAAAATLAGVFTASDAALQAAIAAAGSQDDASSSIDATNVMLSYSNGPLTVAYARENIDGDVMLVGNTTDDETTDSVSVAYKMGDLSLAATWTDRENAFTLRGLDTEHYFVGAKYAMGNNEISLGYADLEGDLNGANVGDADGYIVGFKHNMSKSTNVYAGYQSQDGQLAGAAAVEDDRFAVGIQHKF